MQYFDINSVVLVTHSTLLRHIFCSTRHTFYSTPAHILQYFDTHSVVLCHTSYSTRIHIQQYSTHILQYPDTYSAVFRHVFCSNATYILQYSDTYSAVFRHVFCSNATHILQYSNSYFYFLSYNSRTTGVFSFFVFRNEITLEKYFYFVRYL